MKTSATLTNSNPSTNNASNPLLEGVLTMKGTIGTRQSCPECGSSFELKDNDGYYCCNHTNVRPTRYYVQGKYFGLGLLYSTPEGIVLNSHEEASRLLNSIRTAWDSAKRGGKQFSPDDYIPSKVKSKRINEIVLKYIEAKERVYRKQKLSKSQWQQINNICNRFIVKFFNNQIIDSITDSDIQEFYDYLQDMQYTNKRGELESYSDKHIRDIMMMLRCLYNFVKKPIPDYPQGWTDVEPKRNKRTLTLEEQMKIAPHIPNRHGYPLAINILQNTGMRVCELRALTVGDVTDRSVIVWKSLTDRLKKTRKGYAKEQTYPLPKYIMDDVRDHIKGKGPDDFIFTVNGSPYSLSTLRAAWYTALKKAGVSRIHLSQGGRTTWASREMQTAKEEALERIQKQLGHTNKNTSQKHYIIEG